MKDQHGDGLHVWGPARRMAAGLALSIALVTGCGSSRDLIRAEMAGVEERLQDVESDLATVSDRTRQQNVEIETLHRRVGELPRAGVGVSFNIIETVAVQFPVDRAELTPDAAAQLDRLVERLRATGSALLYVRGHADATGSPGYNQRLSERRAATVSRHLADALGHLPIPVTTLGLGESSPVADNATATGRAANRRVVVQVLVPMQSAPRAISG